MASLPMVAIAAIPATLLVVSQTVQGTAQSLDAVGIEGEEARRRISMMAVATGAALIAAAATSGNTHAILATGVTAALTVWAFHRITL